MVRILNTTHRIVHRNEQKFSKHSSQLLWVVQEWLSWVVLVPGLSQGCSQGAGQGCCPLTHSWERVCFRLPHVASPQAASGRAAGSPRSNPRACEKEHPRQSHSMLLTQFGNYISFLFYILFLGSQSVRPGLPHRRGLHKDVNTRRWRSVLPQAMKTLLRKLYLTLSVHECEFPWACSCQAHGRFLGNGKHEEVEDRMVFVLEASKLSLDFSQPESWPLIPPRNRTRAAQKATGSPWRATHQVCFSGKKKKFSKVMEDGLQKRKENPLWGFGNSSGERWWAELVQWHLKGVFLIFRREILLNVNLDVGCEGEET